MPLSRKLVSTLHYYPAEAECELQTTDTHGWLRGHLGSTVPEPNGSGDLGDLLSFVTRFREQDTSRDVLLVDSGDTVDGNGLVDVDPGVKGHAAREIFSRMPYDLLTIGNRASTSASAPLTRSDELYNYTVALDVHRTFVPRWQGRYVVSNVEITLPNATEPIPFAPRFRRFVTPRTGLRVLSFGVLFAFPYAASGLHVHSPRAMTRQPWFQAELTSGEPVDLFLIVGHMAVQDPAWLSVLEAIRVHHPKTPIVVQGGHAHVRACRRPDRRSILMASGRYMETVGHVAITGLSDATTPPRIDRRYLDQNRATFRYHLNATDDAALDTDAGLDISARLTEVATSFNLSTAYGYVPRDYYLNRYPMDHPGSLVHLLTSSMLPLMIRNGTRPFAPLVVLNTGSVRFDLSKGPMTLDSQALVMPFLNRAVYVRDVPRRVAEQLTSALHGEPGDEDLLGHGGELEHRRQAVDSYTTEFEISSKLSYGYVTRDGCALDGAPADDTPHRPLPAWPLPEYVGTALPPAQAKLVDVACFDFISPVVIRTLNKLQSERIYTATDIEPYSDISTNVLLLEYAKRYWPLKQ